jgi:prepilin-type N-terminal cleavage/methylation domain-containing protein
MKRSDGLVLRPAADDGFTLVEVMVAMLVLSVGLVAVAQLLAVTTVMHSDARQATRSMRLAADKLEELGQQSVATSPALQIGGTFASNLITYSDQPQPEVDRRWVVQAGPAPNTRRVTVRVINRGRRLGNGQTELTTVLR